MIFVNVELFCLSDDGSGESDYQIVKIKNWERDDYCLFEYMNVRLVQNEWQQVLFLWFRAS
jgi:hypothetical protein